jgi:hypothetical protein
VSPLSRFSTYCYKPCRILTLTAPFHAQQKEWAFNKAYVFAYRNESDRAFEWLEKAIEYGGPGLSAVDLENLFANIHDDPRWLPLLNKKVKKVKKSKKSKDTHVFAR